MPGRKKESKRSAEPKKAWTHHSQETKAKAVELSQSIGPHAAARTLGIRPETVQTWWRIARSKTGTQIARKRSYTDKFRIAAVELAAKHGLSEAARLLDIPVPTLDNWRSRRSKGDLSTTRRRYSPAKREQLLARAAETSTKEAARELRIRLSTARTWVSEDRHRLETNRRSYTDEERREAVSLAKQSTPRLAARQLGIHHNTVKKWCSEAARAEAGRPPRSKASFSDSEKQQAVSLALSEGKAAAVAKFERKGLSERLLSSWLKKAGHGKSRDRSLRKDGGTKWISEDYPQYSQWQSLADAWLATKNAGKGERLGAVRKFILYLDRFGVPGEPAVFLSRAFPAVDFFTSMCPDSSWGATLNNGVSEFIDWVLLSEFSLDDDHGYRLISPAFRNPVPRKSFSGVAAPAQSVYTPLPYGYIAELRKILASGRTFREWTFATSAMGLPNGKDAQSSFDWFEVPARLIDDDDPDCVHRVREDAEGRFVVEMWSPVRWVALLTKLILPLRTFQVCVLDSGESDSLLYRGHASGSDEQWVRNTSPLCSLHGRTSWSQGVFRRASAKDFAGAVSSEDEFLTLLYINTNKTADAGKEGAAKGYLMPWVSDEDVSSNIFFWLEKLRNWQAKYNPIEKRTSWTELDPNHITPKTASQLARYPDACFLFRFAEAKKRSYRHLPLNRDLLDTVWYLTLLELERRLSARGEKVAGEHEVQLVNRQTRRALFPMHSLRVSLITSLALDGKLSLVVLQKLVGHSRLLMTLYYVVPGAERTAQELRDATRRMKASSEDGIVKFLAEASLERLSKEAVFNDKASALLALPKHPASRNPAGWMKLHHGACLVGGNTSPIESESKIGGCFNGGPNSGTSSKPRHEPVPGGAYNCVRCRWFVTTPSYIEALAAHFNVVMYHYGEAEAKWAACDERLKGLLTSRMSAEEKGMPFLEQAELKTAERQVHASISKLLELAYDLDATLTLVERCVSLRESGNNDTALVAVGDARDVKIAIEKVSSNVLQLAVACQAVEVFTDLNPGKAVLQMSQIIDAALMRAGRKPFMLQLTEPNQLKVGNALLRSLAQTISPDDEWQGLRKVTSVLEARGELNQFLNADFDSFMKKSIGNLLSLQELAEIAQ